MNDENKKVLKFKKIKNKLLLGIDIGGTLTKLCIVCGKDEKEINDFLFSNKIYEYFDLKEYNLFLTSFFTTNLEKTLFSLLKDLNDKSKIEEINSTGGGAYKYEKIIKNNFNVNLIKIDELQSLINGYIFMNYYNNIFEIINNNEIRTIPFGDFKFPHISVNIGSGVSILKVLSPDKYERIGGTLMGGGTLIGLSKLIIGIDNFDKILELANQGNIENVDITTKDLINNSGDEKSSEIEVISSLGKIHEYIQSGKKDKIKKEDISLSLLNMICSHISQYSVLYAEKNKIDTIYYFGTFTKKDSITNKLLNKTSKHWNKEIKIRFNYLGGYLGTLGSVLEY